ncbi:hypothetical protein [Amycolatopsis plumensis]
MLAAHAVPLVTLPSGIWRLFLAAGADLGLLSGLAKSSTSSA